MFTPSYDSICEVLESLKTMYFFDTYMSNMGLNRITTGYKIWSDTLRLKFILIKIYTVLVKNCSTTDLV